MWMQFQCMCLYMTYVHVLMFFMFMIHIIAHFASVAIMLFFLLVFAYFYYLEWISNIIYHMLYGLCDLLQGFVTFVPCRQRSFQAMDLFLLPKIFRCRVASLLFSALKVDWDENEVTANVICTISVLAVNGGDLMNIAFI